MRKIIFILLLIINSVNLFCQIAADMLTVPGGVTGNIQYNLDGTFFGLLNPVASDSTLKFNAFTNTYIPESGTLVGSYTYAGREMLGQIANGSIYAFQSHIGLRNIATWVAVGVVTTTTQWGMAVATAGTATARNFSQSNKFTQNKRIGYLTSTSASQSAYVGHTGAKAWGLSAGAGLGGFLFVCTFGISDATYVASTRVGVGMKDGTFNVSNNPSSEINCIIIGADTGDTTMQIMHNDASGTCTKVDLGTSFPANTANTDWYQVIFSNKVNSSTVNYHIINKNNGVSATGTISTNLPATSTAIAPMAYRNNASSGAAVAIDVGYIYVETDY